MTLSGWLIFCSVYAMAVATPGPGVTSVVARVLAGGPAGIWAFVAGMIVGDVVWLSIVAAGLAVVARHFEGLFIAIRLGGCAYLLWIAYRLWTSPPMALTGGTNVREGPWRLFVGALSLTLGNPKVILFFLALLPSLIDLDAMSLGIFALAALSCVVILSGVLAAYVLAAAQARKFFTSARALRRLNRATATVIAGAALTIAVK